MEIGRLINVERISGRLPSDQAKANGKSRKRDDSGEGQEVSVEVKKDERASEYKAPINFEYLPSGRILLNREARKQVIDFFE
jgi:hypothetical protein